jgi:protein SCO1/2
MRGRTATHVRLGALGLALYALAGAGLVWKIRREEQREASLAVTDSSARIASAPPPLLWPVPDFHVVDQEGRPVARDDLAGRVWIADFIYTRCTSVCPVLSARMVQLQRRFGDRELRFVSFSIDPAYDTPARLRDYAWRWHPGETRWLLMSTTADGIRALASAVHIGIGEADSGEPTHAAQLLLIDRHGQVRGVYSGEVSEGLEALERDARMLLGPPTPAEVEVSATLEARGQALYARLGCAGCHESESLAPSLSALWGKPVHLAGGEVVTADSEYVRESILEPGRRLVQGYAATMPSYRRQLDEDDLDALLAWISARGKAGESDRPKVGVMAIDPVCGMEVHIGPATPNLSLDGRTEYFCSEKCRERFRIASGQWHAQNGTATGATPQLP